MHGLTLVVGGKTVSVGSTFGKWTKTVKAPTKIGAVKITGACDMYGSITKVSGSFIVVKAAPLASKLSVSGRALSAKRSVSLTLKLKLDGKNANAKVEVYDGKKLKMTVQVKKGKASVKLTKLKKGKHTFKVAYSGKGYKPASKSIKLRVR